MPGKLERRTFIQKALCLGAAAGLGFSAGRFSFEGKKIVADPELEKWRNEEISGLKFQLNLFEGDLREFGEFAKVNESDATLQATLEGVSNITLAGFPVEGNDILIWGSNLGEVDFGNIYPVTSLGVTLLTLGMEERVGDLFSDERFWESWVVWAENRNSPDQAKLIAVPSSDFLGPKIRTLDQNLIYLIRTQENERPDQLVFRITSSSASYEYPLLVGPNPNMERSIKNLGYTPNVY